MPSLFVEKSFIYAIHGRILRVSGVPGGSVIKNLPAVQETQRLLFNCWVGKIP